VPETRRHAAPRSDPPPGHRRARSPRLPWVRPGAGARTPKVAAQAPTSHRAGTPKSDAPRQRDRRAVRPEPVAEPVTELSLTEFGADAGAIHLPGVFRLDAGRRGRPPGPDDFVHAPAHLVEPTEAPYLGPGIPRQAGGSAASGRHARKS
jgi:hypothetical protein